MLYGGFWIRLNAHNIDLIILLPAYYLLGFFISSNQALFLTCGGLTLLYEILFTISKWQGTPGKKIMHLQVVDDYNRKLTFGRSLLRSVVKALTVATLFIGFALIALHPRKKGLHDRIAGTTIIFEEGL